MSDICRPVCQSSVLPLQGRGYASAQCGKILTSAETAGFRQFATARPGKSP